MEYSLDQYFKETAPKDYQFLGYYQYRKSQKDFTNNFCLEARRLNKCLEYLVECRPLADSMEGPVKSREGKHLPQLRIWQRKKVTSIGPGEVAHIMTQGTEEGVGTIMRNVNMKLIRNRRSEITHYTNLLDCIMKGLFDDPDKHIVQWPNTALNESKARRFEGEVSPPSNKGDVYKNCNNLICLSIFMKDNPDSSIDKGVDIKVLGFQCVDDIELSLKVQDIFHKSFEIFYTKLCNPGDPESLTTKAIFKQDTLGTPKFKN
ncbi:1204_t:CDS:2, partial [Entrophospora sp. SA101]